MLEHLGLAHRKSGAFIVSTVDVFGSCRVRNENNLFQWRQPETLGIILISSRVPIHDKVVVPYTINYTQKILHENPHSENTAQNI